MAFEREADPPASQAWETVTETPQSKLATQT